MSDELRERLGLAAVLFAIATIWILQYPYKGIEDNDSALYTFLALTRLHPQSLGADVFIRFGSQDSFTLFGPLYAAAIGKFGLEPSAALLSFIGQFALFICAWLFARSVTHTRLALLAVGLLVALPSDYGADHQFQYVESFLTPRQLAEAAVLAALAAAMSSRGILTAVCLVAAALLHPIMAAAGFVMVVCLYVGIPRPRLAMTLAGGLVLVSLVPILIVPLGTFAPFDLVWLELSDSSSSYLFMSRWRPEDWMYIAAPVSLLAIGAITNTVQRVRTLCVAALLMAASAIAVNLLFVDLLHSIIFTRMQPWRWFWLVECLAVLLLPDIARDCWRKGNAGRGGLVLLAAVWVLSHSTGDSYVAAGCVALAGVAVFVVFGLENSRSARAVLSGAVLLLLGAMAFNLIFKLQFLPLNPTLQRNALWLDPQTVHAWGSDGIFFVAALLGIGWARALILLPATAAAACLLSPFAWASWTDRQYPDDLHAAFAPWRAALPAQAEGIFPRNPMGDWYLLERPSYYSLHQITGDIFSREKAVEIRRRAGLITSALRGQSAPQTSSVARSAPPTPLLNENSLTLLCKDPALDFYVTRSRLNLPDAAPVIVPNPRKPLNEFHLYRCADVGR